MVNSGGCYSGHPLLQGVELVASMTWCVARSESVQCCPAQMATRPRSTRRHLCSSVRRPSSARERFSVYRGEARNPQSDVNTFHELAIIRTADPDELG
jgi:hypothetical protein